MNPILIILIFISGGILWLLCSSLFRPIGEVSKKLLNGAREAMYGKKEKEEKEK